MLDGFAQTWAGECSAWECDDLGHMNMRHYVHKMDEARRGLVIRLGLTGAYYPGTSSTVRCRDFHIKYQGEARPGDPLRIDSAVIALGESTAKLCHIMTHRDGRTAATVIETVEHVYLPEDKIFGWPKRVHAVIPDFTADIPSPAKARNVDPQFNHVGMSQEALKTAGAKFIGTGVFSAAELDVSDRVTMGSFFGRTTSTIGWFSEGWPEFQDATYTGSGKSGALLEMRAVVHHYPREGDAYIYAPAMISANAYTREFVHNLVDPISGNSWVSMQASACKFDLKARALIKSTEADLAVLQKNILKDVTA